MKNLIELLRDLCLLRRGPQDLPYSPGLLAALVLALLAFNAVVAAQVPRVSAAQEVFAVLLLLGLVRATLALAGKPERFMQTATAMIGVRIVFMLLSLPLVVYVTSLPQDVAQLTGGQTLVVLLGSAVLFAWQVAVRGHVLRHALDQPMRIGVLVGVIYIAAEVVLTLALFGQERPPT
jgi:hypothetical protein